MRHTLSSLLRIFTGMASIVGVRMLVAALLATFMGNVPAGQSPPRDNHFIETNRPAVWSDESGGVYVRSVPDKATGTSGKTRLYQVKPEGDQLIDEYPYYMPGELHVGRCAANKWCIVQLEPYEARSDIDPNMFKVARLVFYMGGRQIVSYTFRDLESMGLDKRWAVENGIAGSFEVVGIRDIRGDSGAQVFMIRRVDRGGQVVDVPFELATGKVIERSALASSAAAQPASPQANTDTWGEPVEGVQMRLAFAPARSPALPGRLPALEVQVRNLGMSDVTVDLAALIFAQIEIDGVWYGQVAATTAPYPSFVLAPGSASQVLRTIHDGLTSVYEWNARPARTLELRALSPGSHHVRLRSQTSFRIAIEIPVPAQ